MHHTWKKLLALALALMLCVSLLPAAYAEGDLGVLEPVEEAEEEDGVIEPVNGDDETAPEPEPEPEPAAGPVKPGREGRSALPLAGDELLETQSGTCGDDLTWTLDDNGVLTISGTGAMTDFNFSDTPVPWQSYKSQIKSVVLEQGVTSIGEYAFDSCSSMTTVSLPSSLTTIGASAFSYSGLVSVTIPVNVSFIGSFAFDGCSRLEKINVASGNTTYKSVNGVLLTKDGTTLLRCPCAKTGSYTIPTGVVTVGNSAFDCCAISTVTIPGSVKTLDDYAFWSCYDLTKITIPASVTKIGMKAFSYCYHVTEITFQGDAPSIGANCFCDVTAEVSYPLNNNTWTESVRQDYGGSLTWLPGGIHPPVILTQPEDFACLEGAKASFSVEAEGDSLNYQWYYQKSDTDTWTAVTASSGKTAAYSLTTALRHNGYRYKCVVSNGAASVESVPATLTIMVKPTITSQPQSITVMATQKASFTVEATGGALSYKWYYRTSSTASWTAVSAASGKTATYSLTAAERHNGYQYRCKVYNDAGYVYTKTVTLTVKPEIAKPVITTQPKNVTGTVGTAASFTVKVSGEELSYQWYYRQPGTSSWTAVSAASGKTAKYSLTPAARHNGYQYRCKVTNIAGTVTSKTVTLTLAGVTPVILTQPESARVDEGTKVSFTVKAVGTELSYQWYYRTSSTASWKAVSASSGKTAKYSLTTAERHDGYQYRCKITNPQGSVTSKTATLTVIPDPLSAHSVYAAMIALKADYPEGTPWTNENFYAWNGGIFYGGYGCAGFAFMLSDAAFGTLPARQITEVKFENVRVGDILRVSNDSHSVIVLEVCSDYVVLAEGNYNASVHWGRILSKTQVEAATYMMTRYPD